MAKLEKRVYGDIDEIARRIHDGVLTKSSSASLEDSSVFGEGNAKCIVLVFERYSYAGGNRVSMNVTLFQVQEGIVDVSVITSGGSQAMFFKVNTWGEETFLDTIREFI